MPKKNFKQHRPLFTSSVSKSVKSSKIKWKILPVIWFGLKRMAMVLGFLMILNAVIMLTIVPVVMKGEEAPSLPDEMVLFVEFEDGFREVADEPDLFDPFAPEPLTVRQLIAALDAAAEDERVQGVLARMRGGNFALSHVQEVRAAVKRFREAGKFAHIYSSSYGEGGGGLGRYYLASVFDRIWMQPLGIVMIPGVNAEMPFMRGTLDKLGIKPQFYQRKEYKTAYENLTDTGMSTYNRKTLERLVGDIRAEIMSTIPAERGIDEKTFARLVDKGLFTAVEAERAGLITRADYGDILLDDIAEELTGERDADGLDIVNIRQYAAADGVAQSGETKVALVHVSGAILYDDEGGMGGSVAEANKIAPAILAASRDEDIEAIILRVDSPGGSPTASESILRAVEKAKERGKKVVVSMSTVAASGGYWVSAYADRIFVLPTTLTGSIGVVGGKFSIGELSQKAGVNWDGVSWGKNADMWSSATPFGARGAERMNAMMDAVYDAFIERVAKGRGMKKSEVDKVAGGRVWTGARAVEVGLADELGGLDDALDYTAVQLGELDRHDLDIQEFPKPKTPFEKIIALLEGQVMMGQAVKWQGDALKAFQPALEALQLHQIHAAQPVSAYESLRLD